MNSSCYYYRYERVGGKVRRVYVGPLSDPSIAGMQRLAEEARSKRDRELAVRRAVAEGCLELEAEVGRAAAGLKARALEYLDREGYHRPGRFLWRKRRMPKIACPSGADSTRTTECDYAGLLELGGRAATGDPAAVAEYRQALARAPEAVRVLGFIDSQFAAERLLASTKAGQEPAYRERRIAKYRGDVIDLAGSPPSPATVALAIRAALISVELDVADARIVEASGDKTMRPGEKLSVVEWLEGRRDRIERRYLMAMKVLAGVQRVYAVHVNVPAESRPAAPPLGVVG